MSQGAFSEYWDNKISELSSVHSEIFLNDALKYGYFPEAGVLPDFFETNFNTADYEKINIEKKLNKKKTKYNTTYKVNTFDLIKFTHTNGSGYRVYSLMHPFIYWQLCKEIADNLPSIIKSLAKKRDIVSYSIPDLMGLEFRRESGIKMWIQMAEKDLIAESGEYSYLLKADISSFYDSIYTHSISWAIHTKPVAKMKRGNFALLGNRLDKLAQSSNTGQTNGLPIGPITSDILCELVLASLDETVSKRLRKLRVKYKAARYKDDYRFLTHSNEDASTIKKVLTEVLHEYGMNINQNKTSISTDIVESYARDWKHTLYKFGLDRMQPDSWSQLNTIIDGVYRHQKESFGKQPALSLLEDINKYIIDNEFDGFNSEAMREIIAKLVHMFRLSPSTLPHSIQIIDTLLDSESNEIKKKYINLFTDHFNHITDDDLVAWLYRLHLKVSKSDADGFLSHKLRDKSKMKDLLQGKWIFEDSNYQGKGFTAQSVTLVNESLIQEAMTSKIKVGFRYSRED